jgi:hypothetical protein
VLVALALTPATAQAAPPASPGDPTGVRAAASGDLIANEAGTSDPRFPMRWCTWHNSDGDWGNDCGGFRNVASYAFNDSNANNVVRLYYHTGYRGAWACLGPGDVWDDFATQNIRFTWGAGLDGYMSPANDNVASHAFRSTCS